MLPRLSLAVAAALAIFVAAGCGSDEAPELTAGTSSPPRDRPPLECEVEGFPCTWNEVDPAVVVDTRSLGQVGLLYGRSGVTLDEVAKFVREQPGVVSAAVMDTGVRFRLEGGRPAWIYPRDEFAHHGSDGAARGTPSPGLDAGRHQPPAAPATATASGLFDRLAGSATLFAAESALQERQSVNEDKPGEPKTALILSPYEFEFRDSVAPLVARARLIDNYREDQGGGVTFHADLVSEPNSEEPPEMDSWLGPGRGAELNGPVEFADFLSWDYYNLVILYSHGRVRNCADKPPVGGARAPARGETFPRNQMCPLVWAGRATQESYGDQIGVELMWITETATRRHPGLTLSEAQDCAAREQAQRDAGVNPLNALPLETPGGKPCTFEEEVGAGDQVLLWTEFFEDVYGGGLNHTIVALLVCQSGANSVLVNLLAPAGNQGVLVIGFETVFYTGDGLFLGEEMLKWIQKGRTSKEILAHLRSLRQAREQFMVGEALGPDDEPMPTEPAPIISAETNATYGRDIVLLIDPVTGQPLRDGVSVRVHGVADDGDPDRLWVYPEVVGVYDPEQPRDFAMRVGELDTARPGERYVADRQVDEGTYRYESHVALGRDHQAGERVDLEVRTELPGGNHSRWTYKNIELVETCGFTAIVSGGQFAGRHDGVAFNLGNVITLSDSNSPWEAMLSPAPGRVREGTFEDGELMVLAVRMETPDAPTGVGIWHTTPEAPAHSSRVTIEAVDPDRRTGFIVGTASGHVGWRVDYDDNYEYVDVQIEFHAVPFSVGRDTPYRQCTAFWEPEGRWVDPVRR